MLLQTNKDIFIFKHIFKPSTLIYSVLKAGKPNFLNYYAKENNSEVYQTNPEWKIY